MPLIGLYTFLPLLITEYRKEKIRFNALNRAIYISTEKRFVDGRPIENVSMPLIGLYTFLHCQLPQWIYQIQDVSMPLIGLYTFLLYQLQRNRAGNFVSMPLIGLYTFLHDV